MKNEKLNETKIVNYVQKNQIKSLSTIVNVNINYIDYNQLLTISINYIHNKYQHEKKMLDAFVDNSYRFFISF